MMSCCEGPTNLRRVEVLKGVVHLGFLGAALGVEWLRHQGTALHIHCLLPTEVFSNTFLPKQHQLSISEINLRMTHSRKSYPWNDKLFRMEEQIKQQTKITHIDLMLAEATTPRSFPLNTF